MIVSHNPNEGYNNQHSGDAHQHSCGANQHSGNKLPIKWYYKWWAFILGDVLLGIILCLPVLFGFTPLWYFILLFIIGFAVGLIWGILRRRHIEYLKGEEMRRKAMKSLGVQVEDIK